MMNPNVSLTEQTKIVTVFGPAIPSTSKSDVVSLKGYNKCTFIIVGAKTTGVTGSAISLEQYTTVASANAKPLGMVQAYRALNAGPAGVTDALTAFAVASNTFTMDATPSVTDLYVVEVADTDLDMANNFDCVALVMGTAVAETLSVIAILWPAKIAQKIPPSAIID